MAWQNLSTDWQITWLNLLTLASMGIAMKVIALFIPVGTACCAVRAPYQRRNAMTPDASVSQTIPPADTRAGTSQRDVPTWPRFPARSPKFILSPVLAPNSLERSQPLSAMPSFLWRGGACLGALILYYWIYWKLVNAFHVRGIALSYLVAPAVLLTTEVFVATVTILWLPSGRLLPVLHRNPFAARSVADFWGRRWNLWMSEWFRYAVFTPLRRHPVLALWLVFFLSGLLHEYVLNLSLWLVTGQKLFGTMMLYFLLQPVGVLIERRFLNRRPRANSLFTWLIVFAPVPLVFHESMLRTLHLWPG